MHETTKRLYESAEKLKGVSSQVGVARLIGKTAQVVANWEKRGMSKAGILDASKAIGCSAKWLETGAGDMTNGSTSTPIPASYVPLISWVSAGQWRAAIDDRETYDQVQCPVTARGKGTFALEVRGVSMYNPKGKDSFAEKDIIFVDPSRDANSGDYVVAMHTDQYQATFKQLFCEDGRKFLKALNPDWQPNIQEINQDTILVGVVIAKVTTQVFK